MSDLLNYRPSHSATHYTPRARIDVPRTIVGFVGAALGAVVGGVIYGHIQDNLLDLWVRVGAALAAAGVTGLLGLVPVRYGKVRIALVAATLGAVISMIALYAMWVSWVHTVLLRNGASISPQDLALHPLGLMRVIRMLNRTGTWMYDGDVVRGPMLLVYWLCEAGFVLAAGVLIPVFGLYSSDPTCMGCGSRCRRVPGLPRFAVDRQADFVAALENREFDLLLSHAAPTHADVPELSIQLMSCPKCEQTNVLTINRVGWVADSRGRLKVAIKPLLKDLLIATDEAEKLIMDCAQVKEQRAAGTAPETADDTPAQGEL